MWQDVLMIIAIGLSVYSIYDFGSMIIKKIINNTKISKKIYSFKGKIRYYPLLGLIIFMSNLIGLTKKSDEEIIISKYMLSVMVQKLYSKSGTLNKLTIGILSLFLIINFILSILVKPIMYEEGIVCYDGNFLSWDKIKSITTVQNQIGSRKFIVINTANKEIYLRVANSESNKVKEIIFNKTGIVNKEIVTEFN
ncbi:hypothetical protein H8S10_00005 [Clostridium sp. NSJ-49]|uniref:Uncharacterized protein n=1 Tax=Clostridium disporicum TaxID=84024 RepID=A0A173YJC5_9CLOT|nr:MULTISPECIES: hypothetical protein [Clostridium]MBC5623838.1 hypothetical protein [Clostridium sp. NSJ-49]MCD2501700.1 hypothetical protein [Clostridium sp. NSJ-145]MDU6340508.1 hypothetical protein [Clostridium sp.]CUN64242.1 Uncharacterised protein [Clostridium disporicum]